MSSRAKLAELTTPLASAERHFLQTLVSDFTVSSSRRDLATPVAFASFDREELPPLLLLSPFTRFSETSPQSLSAGVRKLAHRLAALSENSAPGGDT